MVQIPTLIAYIPTLIAYIPTHIAYIYIDNQHEKTSFNDSMAVSPTTLIFKLKVI